MSDTHRGEPSGPLWDETGIIPPPFFTTRRVLTVVVAVVLVVAVILGVQWLKDRSRSEGAKLGDALGEPCERVGIIAAFGGRSNLYRCTTTDQYGYEKPQCAIWADGAAYDVTKQARALFRLQAQDAPC